MGITVIDKDSNDDAIGAICIGTLGFDAYLLDCCCKSVGWQEHQVRAAIRAPRVPLIIEAE